MDYLDVFECAVCEFTSETYSEFDYHTEFYYHIFIQQLKINWILTNIILENHNVPPLKTVT